MAGYAWYLAGFGVKTEYDLVKDDFLHVALRVRKEVKGVERVVGLGFGNIRNVAAVVAAAAPLQAVLSGNCPAGIFKIFILFQLRLLSIPMIQLAFPTALNGGVFKVPRPVLGTSKAVLYLGTTGR